MTSLIILGILILLVFFTNKITCNFLLNFFLFFKLVHVYVIKGMIKDNFKSLNPKIFLVTFNSFYKKIISISFIVYVKISIFNVFFVVIPSALLFNESLYCCSSVLFLHYVNYKMVSKSLLEFFYRL